MPKLGSVIQSIFFLLVLLSPAVVAQNSDFQIATKFLLGEFQSELFITPNPKFNTSLMILRTEKEVTVLLLVPGGYNVVRFFYRTKNETKIVSANFKSDDYNVVLILLSDGNLVTAKYNGQAGKYINQEPITPNISLVGAQKIVGDAVYVIKSGKVYASWDTLKTWSIDSINIGKFNVSDISVDTNHYAWVSTNQGIYYQHPDSNIWRKAAPLPTTFQNVYSIFVDRRNRIFVSRPGQVFVSTDKGLSWTDISSGAVETIASFSSDAFGNVYAVGTGSKAYRLSNLTPPWITISDSINAQAYLPSNGKVINSISGDSILFAATRYGMFQSNDFGDTWIYAPNIFQSHAHIFYTGTVRAGKYYFVSTNLGIYRVIAGDTTWEKIFPKQGFLWGVNNLSSDSAGNIYSNIPFKTGPASSIFFNIKSTDYGSTWMPDTAGQKKIGLTSGTQTYDFFVDKQGVQYLSGNGILYSKMPGQSWKVDTAGLGIKSGQYIADISLNNTKGITYVGRRTGDFPTYTFALYQRKNGDSVWHVVNTSSLNTSEGRLISDNNGNIVIRTLSSPYKIWRYDGSTWTDIPLPAGLGTSPFALHFSTDRSGVIWGVFVGSNLNKGVYFTANNGVSWKYVGLAGVGIKFLTAVEDTVFAVSFIDGIHAFTTTTQPTSVSQFESRVITSYELFQNYPNPFNPSTTIQYSIPHSTNVRLQVFDILGREIATLVNKEQLEGTYSVKFNAEGLSTGMYLYSLTTKNYTAIKKLLLMK